VVRSVHFHKSAFDTHNVNTGSIVLTSRELTRIPSYLFESHLSLTPEPLPNSPPEVVEPEVPTKIKRSTKTTWYEQADLTSLKVWDNAIIELQPELSLFGSLKVLDVSMSMGILNKAHLAIASQEQTDQTAQFTL
jgi:hypothetical protein